MDAKTNPNTEAQRQALQEILLKVAESSEHIAELSRLVITHETDGNGAVTWALTSAIEVLSLRAGWLADFASMRLVDNCGTRSSDANEWFMSPTMAAAIEASSTNQSSNVNANGEQHA